MIYLLDTNVCIACLRQNPKVLARLATVPPASIRVCSVVTGELYYGAAKSQRVLANLRQLAAFLAPYSILSFDEASAQLYGAIRAGLEMAGTPIGPYDLQIAAIALANGLTLVTNNQKEFSRVSGLSLDNWQ